VDNLVKQRVIGAVVLVALAVIFIPMLLESPEEELGPLGSNLPERPEMTVRDRVEPLTLPEPPPESEPAQVVLEPLPADDAAAGTAEPGEASQPPSGAQTSSQTPPAASATPSIPTEEPAASRPAVSEPPVASAPPTSPPAAAKQTPEAAKPLSGWVVQLAALSSKDNAMALRERLRGLGYTAFVEETTAAQGTQFRVRVGPELERANADNLRTRLEQQVQIKGIVMRYP